MNYVQFMKRKVSLTVCRFELPR